MSTIFQETGGGVVLTDAGGSAFAIEVSPIEILDPDAWVVSLWRTLKAYVEENIDTSIYQIVFGFPSAEDLGQWMPLDKTMIHFEIDDIRAMPLGFGQNIVDSTINEDDQSISEHEANVHMINFDVGVWASKKSGGVTARLRAFQRLNDIFVGANAYFELQNRGIELMGFNGGSFIKEEIDNISIFRVMSMMLEIKIYSRTIKAPVPYISDFFLDPQLRDVENIPIQE